MVKKSMKTMPVILSTERSRTVADGTLQYNNLHRS